METSQPDIHTGGTVGRYVSGTLGETELETFEAHLLVCRRCQEEVRLGLAIRAALPSPVSPSGAAWWWSRTPVWRRAAAAVVLVVGAGLLVTTWDNGVPSLPTRELAAGLSAPNSVGWDQTGWSATRGEATTAPQRQRAFRIGARLVDLHAARAAGDTVTTRALAGEILRYLESVPFSEPARSHYAAIQLAAPRDTSPAAERNVEVLLRETLDAEWLAFGQWSEAARLAAVTSNERWLATAELDRVLRAMPREWPEIEEARDALANGVTPEEIRLLERLFTGIVRRGGG